MAAASSPGVAGLLGRLESAVTAPDTRSVCQQVKAVLMEELGQGRIQLPPAFLRSVASGYARRRLFLDREERFSVVVMVWDPGQRTPLHDHAGHWCVECVYAGKIRVTSFDLEREEPERALFRRREAVDAGVGTAGALIPPFQYHTIENPFDHKAVTIHVYKEEITWCHAFESLDESGWFRPQRRELTYSA